MSTLAKSIEAAVAALSAEQKAALVEALSTPPEPVAVVGLGCRLPGGGVGPDGLWRLLEDGVDAIQEIPADRWDGASFYDPDPSVPGKMSTRFGSFLPDVRSFDAGFFQISPREAAAMDPQQRILLEVAVEALEHAGLAGPALAGSRTGVFVGVSAVEYAWLGWPFTALDAYASSGTSKSILANRLSYQLDLRGPSLAIDTACSSSLVAAHLACKSLRAKESDAALVAGVNVVVSPMLGISYSKWGMMAPDGRCKTFDARADGFVRGEGCGVVVLKRLKDAQAAGDRIHAVIRGSAVNQDGRSAGLTAPNLEAQIQVIKAALADARIEPRQISYVEAHGTGTALGDPIEVEALAEVFQGSTTPCALGSIKTNLGHLEGAAGIAGLLKVVLALSHRTIPPHLHLETLNPKVRLADTPFRIPRQKEAWTSAGRRAAGVSSFGFGGTNAHLVLEEAPELPSAPISGPERPQALLLSGHNEAALQAQLAQFQARLAAHPEQWAALAEGSVRRGARYAHRAGVVASSGGAAAAALEALAAGRGGSPATVAPRAARKRTPRLAFVCTGQGSAWIGMGRRRLETDPDFRQAFAEVDAAGRAILGWSLAEALAQAAPNLLETERAQPAIFGLQVALAQTLARRGVRPSAVVGHSVGEISAAVIAGILSLEQGLGIIRRRAALMQPHEGHGRMAEVGLPASEIEAALVGTRLAVAAINHREATVIAGDTAELEAFAAQLRGRGVEVRPLEVRCAFHGRALRAEGPRLAAQLAELRPGAEALPFYSTVTGTRLSGAALDGAHFGRNLGEPVRFADAIERMGADGYDLYLELGPHPSLGRSIDRLLGARVAIATMQRGQPDDLRGWHSLLTLECEGVAVDWTHGSPAEAPFLPPPSYPWQRKPYWGSGATPPGRRPASIHPFIREQLVSSALQHAVFELDLESPIVAQHCFGEQRLVPTVGVVEAVRAASLSIGQPVGQIDHLVVHRGLLLAPGEDRRAQLVLDRQGGFEVLSCGSPERGEAWTVHFSGRLLPPSGPSTAASLSRPELDLGAGSPGGDYYRTLEAQGARLGPAFARIDRLLPEGRTAWARLTPLLAGDAAAATCGLDVALHLFWAALAPEQRPAQGGYLPIGFESIELWGPAEAACYARAELRAIEAEGASLHLDAGVYDAEGRPVMVFRGARYLPVEVDQSGLRRSRLAQRDVYQEAWIDAALPPAGPLAGRWAVLNPEGLPVDALVSALRARGAEVSHGLSGSIQGVIDLSLGSTTPLDRVEALAEAAWALSQRLLKAPAGEWIIGTQRARAFEGAPGDPFRAALLGMVKTAALERPQLRLRAVDVDDWTALAAECGASAETSVRYRGARRQVARLRRRPVEVAPRSLGPEASYLITGGGGPVGLAFAEDLLARGARHLCLLSRSPLPASTRVALEARGAQVQSFSVDVADPAALAAVWAQIEPPVAGVVHAAGVNLDERLDQLSAQRVAEALRAKVGGALNLAQLSDGRRLDFLLLVGSAAGALGSVGQASYAVANAFLSAWAEARHARGQVGHCLAFGPFGGAGMAARLGEAGRARAQGLGVEAVAPELAIGLWPALQAEPAALLFPVDWGRFLLARGQLSDPYFGELRPAEAVNTLDLPFLAALSTASPKARLALLAERIRAQLAQVLAIDSPETIPTQVGLFELGLDSMTAVELSERLQARLGIRLPATLIFERPTIEALAEHLVSELQPQPPAEAPDALADKSEAELVALLEQELEGAAS